MSEKLQDVTRRRPNPDLVAALERLLKEAKAGELISMYYGCGWAGDWASSGFVVDTRTNRILMLGNAHLAVQEFQDVVKLWHGDSVLHGEFPTHDEVFG